MAQKQVKLQIFIPANLYVYKTFAVGIKTKKMLRS